MPGLLAERRGIAATSLLLLHLLSAGQAESQACCKGWPNQLRRIKSCQQGQLGCARRGLCLVALGRLHLDQGGVA